MKDVYSLCIGREKLNTMKKSVIAKISHKASYRWINMYKRRIKKIRFYHQQFSDEGIFTVISYEKITILRETIIVLTVKYENS